MSVERSALNVERSGPVGHAVFLSYASQDAVAANRIAEALRAAGVEVWFDQSELAGGDAWDAKIRKQIRECALFVPIISAHTQARREGYFRIEWKLAAQRTHAIAEGTPFLLPVVLDGVPDAEALVPPEFREVQWTALSNDTVIARFCDRLRQLIGGSPAERVHTRGTSPAHQAARPATGKVSRVPFAFAALGVLVIAAALFAFLPPRDSQAPASTTVSRPQSIGRSAELAERPSIETRDQLDVAVEQARRGTETSPDSAAAWAKRARLEAQHIVRGWDVSEQRRQDTQASAKRALAIDPSSVDAMYALTIVLLQQGAFSEAEALMRKAIAREPNDSELRQSLGTALSGQGRDADALDVRQETLRLFPGNPFAHYDLALSFEKASPPDLEAALRKFEDSLAIQRFTNTVLHKASLLAGWKGDLTGARRLLDELDPLERTGDRAVGLTMMINLLDRRAERAIEAAGLTARNYFDDDYVRGPKAWLLAHAYAQTGKRHLALAQWREAEIVLRQRIRTKPGNWFDEAGLAITLVWLGAHDEAARLMAPLESLARESPDPLRLLYVAYYHSGAGDAAKVAGCLHAVLNRRELVTEKTLPLDPWWDRIRTRPEFIAFVAEMKGRVQQGAGEGQNALRVEPKSVAVLAFENLSDEKANEYFSDGISEELLNVLAKVPGLRATARTSAFSFKGKNTPIAEIARQLGVAYVIEGSVRKQGNTVRITAQLIKAADGFQLWSDSFDRELKDIFALQDEIAGLIAKALSLKLGTASPAATAKVNPEALRLYLEGRQMWNLRTPEAFVRADMLFRRALDLEPNFARALAGLADVGNVREEVVARAERAIALDPNLAEPHATLGLLEFMDWNFEAADRYFRRAFALNPSYAWAHLWRGQSFMTQGRVDEAMAENQRALAADPLAPRIASNTALLHLLAGEPADALVSADRSLALLPGEPQAQTWKAEALLMLGRAEESLKIAREALAINPSRRDFTYVLARAGDPREVAAAVAAPDTRFANRARSLLAAGRVDEALAGLEADARDSVYAFQFVLFHPAFDGVRNHPRFVRMLESLRMTEAHARAQAWRSAHPPQERRAR